jgi:hypothetical protein
MADIILIQGAISNGVPGDVVVNLGTTICALVLGFQDSGDVICYHWPFFDDNSTYLNVFNDKVSNLTGITVVTNGQDDKTLSDYQKTFHRIHSFYDQIPIKYYVNDEYNGNINLMVVLGEEDIDLPLTNQHLGEKAKLRLLQYFEVDTD